VIFRARANALWPRHSCQCGGLKADIFFLRQHTEQVIHRLIVERIKAIQQSLHGAAHKPGRSAYRQAVCRSDIINT
jgi:hypothetical protein